MGIVLKQSLNNTIVTYLGFAIGAVNTLFLYTRFLSVEYYGLVGVILSASAILMPVLAFGVPNTLVKYYSSFQNNKDSDGFLSLMLFLPLALIVPIGALSYFSYNAIGDFLSRENAIVKGYVWYIFWIGVAMAYFEVFYAWARVQMKSVFGNFMKEVFGRVGVTTLLLLIYLDVISVETFLKATVALYLLRTLIMKIYAYGLKMPKIDFHFPTNTRTILAYSAFIILGGSAAIVILEIDKVMINQYIQIENVAYYSVASYIAMTIAVPSRSMHQITYPITAELLNNTNMDGLQKLYQKSSLTLFIASGLLFVLIIINLDQLYLLLPEGYRGGFTIVFLIGLAKVYDALLGNNNAILYNSDYYRTVLVMGVFLAIITVLFNMWLIPEYGLDGAAIASFMAFFIYNTLKIIFVKWKYDLMPFTLETVKVLFLLLLLGTIFYFVNLPFQPIPNILLKGTVTVIIYIGLLYRFKISEDVFGILNKFLRQK